MKVQLLTSKPPCAFESFSVVIHVEERDQLVALLAAVGQMCNGHGNDLYDLLVDKAKANGMEVMR